MIATMLGLFAGVASQATAAMPVRPPLVTMTPRTGVAPPPVAISKGPARAKANLPSLFTTNDYPAEALRKREAGTVSFAVAIGRDGRVTGCTITASSGSASLDATTCAILQRRARFTPARDASGRAVEDRTVGRIRWALPSVPLMLFADQKRAMILTIDAAGKVAKCRFEGPAAFPAVDQCSASMSEARSMAAEAGKSITIANREWVLEEGLLVGGPDSARPLDAGRARRSRRWSRWRSI